MTRSRWIAIVWGVVLSLGLPVAWAESDPNTKIADRFDVSLDSTKYATSTSIIRSSEGRSEQAIEHLRLDCEVDIADANLVLGISHRGIITQITNGKGEIVDGVDQKLLRPSSALYGYQGLRYRRQFVPPKKPPRWKTAIRSVLRLPPLKSSRPQWLDKLAPSRMMLELDAGLFGPDIEKISRIEGHFYVLRAESFEHVEIPFKPSKEWMRLTPDLEIRVLEAQTVESHYNCRIETRRGDGAAVGPLSPASDLPVRIPAKQQLLGQDGKPVRGRSPSVLLPLNVGGTRRGGGSSLGIIEKIRYVIAVNPSHHKIPFVLEDISLPSPDTTAEASESARAAAALADRARSAPARSAPRARKKAQVVPYTPAGPMSGSIVRQTWMNLRWEGISDADSYDVYLGESFEDVNDGVNGTFQGNQTGTFLIAGFRGFPYPDGLVPGKTYYWRVDEVDSKANSPPKGEVRSFSIAPRTAFNPFPADGAKSVDPNVVLRWTAGFGAKLHTVYFGDDLDTVTNAVDGQLQSARTFTPGALAPGTTYYWRVDEFDVPDTYKGKVWSFTVSDAAEAR